MINHKTKPSKSGRFKLKKLSALLAVPVLLGGVPMAFAELEEIVVFAQKKEESLNDVPISISAFSGDFLQETKVETLFDLQNHTPGFRINAAESPIRPILAIRGVGTSSANIALESSVGVFVDGVFRQRQASAIGDIVDVQSVEILRGPQGSLFGKNTSSGALQVRTVAPNLEEVEGFLDTSIGNDSYRNVKAAINAPLIEGVLGARLSGSYSSRDGFVDNLNTGTDTNDLNRYSLRGQLLYTPTDTFSLRVIADYSEVDEICCGVNFISDAPGVVLPPFAGNITNASQFDDDITLAEVDNRAQIEEVGLSAEINWDIAGGTLTSITSYRAYDSFSVGETDNSALARLTTDIVIEQEAFTQEIRFSGSLGDRFSYTVGAFYYEQELSQEQALIANADAPATLGLPGLFGPVGSVVFPNDPVDAAAVDAGLGFAITAADGSITNDNAFQDGKSIALFAHSDFNLTDQLVLTTGIRYTKDEKELEMNFVEFVPGDVIGGGDNPTLMPFDVPVGTPFFGGLTWMVPGQIFDAPNAGPTFIPQNFASAAGGLFGLFSLAQPDYTEEVTDEQVTGVVRLSYFYNPDTLVYLSYSTGFKSGGINVNRVPVDINGNPSIPITFDAETVESWEIGTKLTLLDNRLQVNASVFHTTFDDFQQSVFTGQFFLLANAGEIESEGIELEVFAAPTDNISVNLGVGYTDAVYSDFGANTGNEVPNSPKWNLNAGVQGSLPLSDTLELYGRLDWIFVDEQEGAALPDNDPRGQADSFTTTNLRLGARIGDSWDVAVWANNLFDKDIPGTGGFRQSAPPGGISAFNTPPRYYGLTVRYTY